MTLVLDASAVVELVLGRAEAEMMGTRVAEADWVIVPTLFASEVTNVCLKYHRFGDISMAQCEEALERSLALPDDFVLDQELAREAFALACLADLSAYDAMYMVLARRHNALLLTMDRTLRRACRKHSVKVVE